MLFSNIIRFILYITLPGTLGNIDAQTSTMTLEQAIARARETSVSALEAKASFVSSYWAWRSYKASRLPSLNLYGNLASFDRSLRQLQNYETGELVYTSNYNMQNSIGLSISQNITFTGGTLSLYSDFSRIDFAAIDEKRNIPRNRTLPPFSREEDFIAQSNWGAESIAKTSSFAKIENIAIVDIKASAHGIKVCIGFCGVFICF